MNRKQLVIQIAADYLVKAYKKVIPQYTAVMGLRDICVSEHAPNTYDMLRHGYDNCDTLLISSLHNETSVYGRDGNITFRTMHDLGHLHHRLSFSLADEISLFMLQWWEIAPHLPASHRTVCRLVYDADTTLQALYEAKHGEFPKDQSRFVYDAIQQYL